MRSSFRRTRPFGGGLGSLFILLMIAVAPPVLCDEAKFDVTAWIEDLHQIRSAMTEKYANFEWAVFERDIDLSSLFDKAEARLRNEDTRSFVRLHATVWGSQVTHNAISNVPTVLRALSTR